MNSKKECINLVWVLSSAAQKAREKGMNMVQMQIIIRNKETSASEPVWEKCCVQEEEAEEEQQNKEKKECGR